MEFKQCSKGHFYDPAISSTCPECAEEERLLRQQEEYVYSGNPADYDETQPASGEGYEDLSHRRGVSDDNRTLPLENGDGLKTEDFVPHNGVEIDTGKTLPPDTDDIPGFTPVVGWLVCVDGPSKGTDYRIRTGYNYIGREENMDIYIKGDIKISREKHAMVVYDDEERVFFFGPVDGKSVVRVNGKLVTIPVEVHSYDIIKIGTTKLMFVPLCGERFNWDV
ncbi:FHA domain-containing protein [Dorea acetigenes]|uniref:FHA domain-containing protein n=1 Tax=Dorea acetigenes TaxID=2981787 RepID=A0ABT2RIG1_9FIRM|nr:FHA domain-containing protein [Dorea acetigenes]MCB6414394.1 FHA domain-containing protein [Faecalimonas umbilicata]MCU6685181.1 FHA domain-containing protein [Dorea acetigenes]SCI39489.1 Uncharacterised protein [uncultured Clostridium sp.]